MKKLNYIVCANGKGSGENVWVRRFLIVCLSDKEPLKRASSNDQNQTL